MSSRIQNNNCDIAAMASHIKTEHRNYKARHQEKQNPQGPFVQFTNTTEPKIINGTGKQLQMRLSIDHRRRFLGLGPEVQYTKVELFHKQGTAIGEFIFNRGKNLEKNIESVLNGSQQLGKGVIDLRKQWLASNELSKARDLEINGKKFNITISSKHMFLKKVSANITIADGHGNSVTFPFCSGNRLKTKLNAALQSIADQVRSECNQQYTNMAKKLSGWSGPKQTGFLHQFANTKKGEDPQAARSAEILAATISDFRGQLEKILLNNSSLCSRTQAASRTPQSAIENIVNNLTAIVNHLKPERFNALVGDLKAAVHVIAEASQSGYVDMDSSQKENFQSFIEGLDKIPNAKEFLEHLNEYQAQAAERSKQRLIHRLLQGRIDLFTPDSVHDLVKFYTASDPNSEQFLQFKQKLEDTLKALKSELETGDTSKLKDIQQKASIIKAGLEKNHDELVKQAEELESKSTQALSETNSNKAISTTDTVTIVPESTAISPELQKILETPTENISLKEAQNLATACCTNPPAKQEIRTKLVSLLDTLESKLLDTTANWQEVRDTAETVNTIVREACDAFKESAPTELKNLKEKAETLNSKAQLFTLANTYIDNIKKGTQQEFGVRYAQILQRAAIDEKFPRHEEALKALMSVVSQSCEKIQKEGFLNIGKSYTHPAYNPISHLGYANEALQEIFAENPSDKFTQLQGKILDTISNACQEFCGTKDFSKQDITNLYTLRFRLPIGTSIPETMQQAFENATDTLVNRIKENKYNSDSKEGKEQEKEAIILWNDINMLKDIYKALNDDSTTCQTIEKTFYENFEAIKKLHNRDQIMGTHGHTDSSAFEAIAQKHAEHSAHT